MFNWSSVASSADGSVLLATTYNESYLFTGVFISMDSGVSWTLNPLTNTTSGTVLDSWSDCAISQNGEVMAICGNDNGDLLWSMNAGQTWSMFQFYSWSSLAMNANGSLIYAAGNVVCCVNNGSYSEIAGSPYLHSIACDATGQFVVGLASSGDFYSSTDGGTNWSQSTIDGVNNAWTHISCNGDGSILVACNTDSTSYGYIYVSRDHGSSWLKGSVNDAFMATAIDNVNGVIYAGCKYSVAFGSGFIYFSLNGGQTWNSLNAPSANWNSITVSASALAASIFAVPNPGVILSSPLATDLMVANACFPAGVWVHTDQGEVLIEQIKPGIHTIGGGNEILRRVESLFSESHMVFFPQNCLGRGLPSRDTIMTGEHLIYYTRQWIPAKHFLLERIPRAYRISYSGEIVYNILMRKHYKMMVNGLTVETLSPKNALARHFVGLGPDFVGRCCKYITTIL